MSENKDNQSAATERPQPNKARRKPIYRWLSTLAIVAGLCFAGWMWVNAQAHSKLLNQIREAGYPDASIGSVSVGPNGVTASELVLPADGNLPGLKIGSLTVKQSFTKLVSGAKPYEQIVIADGNIDLNFESPRDSANFSFADLDLRELTLPARSVSIENFNVTIHDSDSELLLGGISLAVQDSSTQISVSGSIDQSIEGAVEFSGSIDRSSGNGNVEFTGDKLHIVDQAWQRWPGIPLSVLRHLGADAVFDLDANLKIENGQGISYRANIETHNARLFIPKFELPIKIHEGKVRIEDGVVNYEAVTASMGDQDRVIGSGFTTIAGFPCQTEFKGEFFDVDVDDLRKLVKQIPLKVSGTASGKVVGSVDVNSELETTLRISAAGNGSEAGYGKISAAKSTINVEIQPLVLTQEGRTIDLQGNVAVDAAATSQDVDDILATFDLEALDEQFEFDFPGNGVVNLNIPLDSAADLKTWTLVIDAFAPQGNISGMEFRDIKAKSFLRDGFLVFSPASATPVGSKQATNVTVEWPLEDDAANPVGIVTVASESLPPKSALDFLNRQLKNAGVVHRFESSLNTIANSNLDGGLNFESKIVVPATGERPIDSWNVLATVDNSKIELEGVTFGQLGSNIAIDSGILKFTGLTAKLPQSGSLDAEISMDLESSEIRALDVNARQIPADWFARKVAIFTTGKAAAKKEPGSTDDFPMNIQGLFDGELHLSEQSKLLAEAVSFQASSKNIRLFETDLNSTRITGELGDTLTINSITSNIGARGKFSIEGNVEPFERIGSFKAQWSDIDSNPFLRNFATTDVSFETSGSMNCEFVNGAPVVDGNVRLQSAQLLDLNLRDLELNVKSEPDRIVFASRRQPGLGLEGHIKTNAPYGFEIDARSKQLKLRNFFIDDINGMVSSRIFTKGTVQPFSLETDGQLSLRQLRFNDNNLKPIESRWRYSTRQPERNMLSFNGLGGVFSLDTDSPGQKDLEFRIENFESDQLSAFRKLPVKLDGSFSGKAVISNWRNANARAAAVELQTDMLSVGTARLSRLKAKATLSRNGQLEYSATGRLLDGKLELDGKSTLARDKPYSENSFPVRVRLTNARVKKLFENERSIPAARQISGRLSTAMQWNVIPGLMPEGSGFVTLDDLKWKNRIVSRKISSDLFLKDGLVRLSKVSADLRQGEISGRATIPLTGSASGNYELEVRNFSLGRTLDVLMDKPIKADGLIDARISGRTGNTISGSGTLGVSRAGLFGARDQSVKLPIRFQIKPAQRTARMELPRSRFQAFRGNVYGSASLDIGTQVVLDSKLELSNLDSKSLLNSLAGYSNTGKGKLSGHLELKSRNLKSLNDLNGSFDGHLDQSNAFTIPVLAQVSNLLGNTSVLRNEQFDSEQMVLRLSKSRIAIEEFNLRSEIAKVVVTGDAWLDGRLNLDIAARVERLNQPTLLDELATSPLARLTGSPTAFFAQAAEFLSERVLFLNVKGTTTRPQIQINTGKQLREEVIRYFLRGSQILPNRIRLNN